MYVVTGITGQVGGAVAEALLAAGLPIRAIVRDAARAAQWAERGCALAVADLTDIATLTGALHGATAAFVMLPPLFDPSPDFAEARALIASIRAALLAARPERVVFLSTIGADAAEPNLLGQLRLLEQEMTGLPFPTAFVRAAWFIENSQWDIPAAIAGVVHSPLQPVERAIPMVATADIGRAIAGLMHDGWRGTHRVVQVMTAMLSPAAIAAMFADILGRPVTAVAMPRDTWEARFRAQGMAHPEPRMRMLDGFNEGWIAFDPDIPTVHGTTAPRALLAALISAGR